MKGPARFMSSAAIDDQLADEKPDQDEGKHRSDQAEPLARVVDLPGIRSQ